MKTTGMIRQLDALGRVVLWRPRLCRCPRMGEKRLRTGRRQTQGGPMSDHVRELDEKSELRFSHENPDVTRMYEEYFQKPLGHKSHKLLHKDHDA